MMNFFVILAIVFCEEAMLVRADFYVELRALTSTPSSSRRQQSATTNDLYECRGIIPPRATGYRAAEIRCTPVTAYLAKVKIHLKCNFYSVYRPYPLGQLVHFSDDRAGMSELLWHVGFKNNAMDHPDFAEPSLEDQEEIKARVEQMGELVPQQSVNILTIYLAKTNIITSSIFPIYLNSQLSAFVNVLQRIMFGYGNINRNADNARQSINRIGAAMKTVFGKMLDPCCVLARGNFQSQAAQYCSTYCNFLTVVARLFGPIAARCTSLEGGYCVGLVCTCIQGVPNLFNFCRSTTSPMQLCNNLMRVKLNL